MSAAVICDVAGRCIPQGKTPPQLPLLSSPLPSINLAERAETGRRKKKIMGYFEKERL